MGLAAGVNTYSYVANSPLLLLDPYGLATLNALAWSDNSTVTGNSTISLYDWADNYNPANFNTVVIHGNASGQFSPFANGATIYTPEQLAFWLRSSPKYNPKLPTLLIACDSGASSKPGKLSGAQAFANALASKAGPGLPNYNPVYAPTSPVSPVTITSLPPGPDGQPGGFLLFLPKH